MSTDLDWLKWGAQDPYYAVITNEKFRADRLTESAREEFFESGRHHVGYVLDACRRLVDPGFAPKRALDFGCGVGRITIPLAERVAQVVGVDISPHMLAEARLNADRAGRANVDLQRSDDTLSALVGPFDLVHSCITFQHIDIARGRRLFARLLDLLADGGIGAVQITYAKAYHADRFGQPPPPPPPPPPPAPPSSRPRSRLVRVGLRPHAIAEQQPAVQAERDPEMQMNPYSLSELAFILQQAGVAGFQAQFTDHGGELGVFLFFKKPSAA